MFELLNLLIGKEDKLKDEYKITYLPNELLHLIIKELDTKDKLELITGNQFFYEVTTKHFYSTLIMDNLSNLKKQSYLKHYKVIKNIVLPKKINGDDLSYLNNLLLLNNTIVISTCYVELIFDQDFPQLVSHYNLSTLIFQSELVAHNKVKKNQLKVVEQIKKGVKNIYYSNVMLDLSINNLLLFNEFTKLRKISLTGIIDLGILQQFLNFKHVNLEYLSFIFKITNLGEDNRLILDGNNFNSLAKFALLTRGISFIIQNHFQKLTNMSLSVSYATSFDGAINNNNIQTLGLLNLNNAYKIRLSKKVISNEIIPLFQLKNLKHLILESINSNDISMSINSTDTSIPLFPTINFNSNSIRYLTLKYCSIDISFFNLLFKLTSLYKLCLIDCCFNKNQLLNLSNHIITINYLYIFKCKHHSNYLSTLLKICPNLLLFDTDIKDQ